MNILFIAPVGYNTNTNFLNAIHGGYGNATFNTYKVLLKMKEEMLIDQLSLIDISSQNIPKEVIESLLSEYDICICVASPVEFCRNELFRNFIKRYMKLAKRRYFQVVWETEGFPLEFDNLFKDDFLTGFLAPSIWGCKQIQKRTEKPVFYYPHFVDEENFELVNIDNKKNEKFFTVLFVGQYTERKGITETIISFVRSLGSKEDCQLILKIAKMSNSEIDPNIKFKSLITSNTKNLKCQIKMIENSISNEELGKLYEASSVLLFPSKGEGFGLPIAEAMLQGLPVIYTDWSACQEVGQSSFTYPIRYYVDEAYSMMQYGYEKGLKYAIPSIEDICQKLEFLYDEWKTNKEKYYEKYKQNRGIIQVRYGYETIKKTILDIINNVPFVCVSYAGYNNEKTKYLNLKKVAEVGIDEKNYKWVLREDSFYKDILQDEIGANIEHEKNVYEYLLTVLNKETEFIDIGAHVGYYSIRVASIVKKVWAIEANPKNLQGLFKYYFK